MLIKGLRIKVLNFKFSDTFQSPKEGFICPDYKNYCSIMASGRLKTPDGTDDYQVFWDEKHIPSRHV